MKQGELFERQDLRALNIYPFPNNKRDKITVWQRVDVLGTKEWTPATIDFYGANDADIKYVELFSQALLEAIKIAKEWTAERHP